MKHDRPYFWIALLVSVVALTGCGRKDDGRAARSALAGPPHWRLSQESAPAGGTRFTLKTHTPGRARFRFESEDGISRPATWRALAGGQTTAVTWSHDELPPEAIQASPTPEDVAAGRTVAHAIGVSFGFGDRIKSNEHVIAFARPGKGKTLTRSVLPPGTYEPLPSGASIELATLVIADVAQGEVRLRSRNLAGVVHLPDTLGPDDRVLRARLFLDIELVEERQ